MHYLHLRKCSQKNNCSGAFLSTSFRIIFNRKATPQVGLTKLEAKIIAEIKKDNKISRRQIASNLRIKPDTVKEYLNKLKDKRVLRRIGKTSGGYWFVNYKDV